MCLIVGLFISNISLVYAGYLSGAGAQEAGTCAVVSGAVTQYCPSSVMHNGVQVPVSTVVYERYVDPDNIFVYGCTCAFTSGGVINLWGESEPSYGAIGYSDYIGGTIQYLRGDYPLPVEYKIVLNQPSNVCLYQTKTIDKFWTTIQRCDGCLPEEYPYPGVEYTHRGIAFLYGTIANCTTESGGGVTPTEYCIDKDFNSYLANQDVYFSTDTAYQPISPINVPGLLEDSYINWSNGGILYDECEDPLNVSNNYLMEYFCALVDNVTSYSEYNATHPNARVDSSDFYPYIENSLAPAEVKIDCNYVDSSGTYNLSKYTGAICSTNKCQCPGGMVWKQDGTCGYGCNPATFNNSKSFKINLNGVQVAAVDKNGHLKLTGIINENISSITPTGRAFNVIKDEAELVASIDSSGSLFLKGQIYENQNTINPTSGSDFIVQYDGEPVFMITDDGNLYTKTCVSEPLAPLQWWYRDADNDNFGGEVFQSTTRPGPEWKTYQELQPLPGGQGGIGDCYDANANAYPGAVTYYNIHRGDGSFDYNCNGVSDYQLNEMITHQCYNAASIGRIGDIEYLCSSGFASYSMKRSPIIVNNITVSYSVTCYAQGSCPAGQEYNPNTRVAYRR